MVLYIVRHAEPDYEHGTITPYGHKEAAALGEWFAKVKPTRIYTSPLGRAKDTAAYTCNTLGIEPIVLPWTEESMDYMRPFQPTDHCRYRFTEHDGITDFEDFYEEDRTAILNQLQSEADAFLTSLGYQREGAHYRILSPNDERVAVFCHGGFGTALTAHLLGMPSALGFLSMFMTTSAVTTFTFHNYDNGYTRPRMIRFGEVAHLQSEDFAENLIIR